MKEIYFEESTGFTYEKKEYNGAIYYVPLMKYDSKYYPSIDFGIIVYKKK